MKRNVDNLVSKRIDQMKSESRPVLEAILGRRESLLGDDIAANGEAIGHQVRSSRVLVIGAAGSIGGAFVKVLSKYAVAALHLVDISENCLVEVVRDLRSSGFALPGDFKTFAVDYSQPEFKALLKTQSYDFVLNFSALKHVRSERDPFTLMRLLNVNVIANEALVQSLEGGATKHVFSVSSDKSVRPANIMGASKALMERVFLAHSGSMPFTSARFANVAFSAGSLLDSFQYRLAKRQPFSAPNDVKRYFISHEEAGQLCLLGCFLGNNKEIFYPQFKQELDMLSFAEIARLFLRSKGFEPIECESEAEALRIAGSLGDSATGWPCFFSGSDTSGEKPFEEFVDPREATDQSRFAKVGVVTEPVFHGVESVQRSMTAIKNAFARGVWTTAELIEAVRFGVPELNHVATGKNLDEKM
ncbi:UDP-N-acetyl-alpha-D-glucosamine C6 dehydratase [Stieleria neptunia]|uniref:UDP-N-acetyl-alpha-D-glucosamine C6 dehydratase n=1 Tax=Stieleria neptunia TaxID=2527979 RepID=A0A518HTP1_9BACT|nr:polysaccharide biosynthesis protein [Stieleria neptunia]QDV44212.1 UDP-N-acetyl-alpha-D-glucosamine C6 dehydratase [Stieleria neptunia]